MPKTHARFHFNQWRVVFCIFLSLVLGICTADTFAQSGAGSIQGTVTDSTGAAIPAAKIHVVNQGTNVATDTTSNGVGFYEVPGLFAGKYTITFSAPGMKQLERNLVLQVAQTAVISPALTLGEVTEKVTVTGDIVQLATYDNGTVSTNLDNARINQIPMNGRNIMSLAGNMTPGLESGGQRSNGLMAPGIEYVQDGAPVTNRNYGGPATQADPDAIQEVKIETSSSNAMYATPATAVLTTKSGTNALHGTFFETARNNAIGIAKARQNPVNFTAPRLIRNEFGGSVGGPIILPWLYHGKDKSFFFFAYERYSIRSGTYSLSYVPTQAMRNGDFSGLVNGNGQSITLYDPSTTNPTTYQRTPFPNNQIPSGRLSPLGKVLNAITPLPTNTSINPLVQQNISYPATNNTTAPTITFRLDHTFNERNNAYLRYTSYNSTNLLPYSTTQEPATVAGAGLPANVANLISNLTTQYNAGLGFTHIFSPTFVSQTVIGNIWESTWANLPPGGADANWEKTLGLPNNFGESGMPHIFGPIYQFSGTQVQWGGPQLITNIDENLTKTLGKHQLFFGGRYRHERLGVQPDRTGDEIDFNGMGTANYNPASGTGYTAMPYTGNSNADLYLGSAYYYGVRLNPGYENWRGQEFDAYIQDDFHVTSRLTINAGLRYEAHPVATERHNLINGFDVKNDALVMGLPTSTLIQLGYTTQSIITNLQNLGVVFENAQQAGLPEHLIYGNNAVFSPRIGFAYSLFGSGHGTVLRAGYGRYAYPIPLRNFYATAKLNQPFAGNYYQNYTQGAQSPDGLNNYILRSPQTVIAGQNSANVVNSSTINALQPGVTELVLNPHYPPNMVWELNTTLEQPLKPSSVLRLSYVYEHSYNLDQQNQFNNTIPTYVWDTTTGTTPPGGTYSAVALNPYDNHTYGGLISDDRKGWTEYNGMQANYQRLYKNGYAYQLFYVFGKTMRVGGNAFRDGIIYPSADYLPGIAPSNYDALNRFENYQIDSAIPKHHVSFNGIVDLPVGRGKKYLGHVNRLVDEVIGGYQIAFDGGVWSQYFQPSSSNWGGVNPQGTGSINPLQIYKKKYRITDCSSGSCHAGNLWFNGFISPLQTNNPCGTSAITGVPSTGYTPYETPINMDPGTITCSNGTAKASNSLYLTNNVTVPLKNGSSTTLGYNPGPAGVNPFSHTYLLGPFNWSADVSIFKVFPITERVNLRVNADAFNAFNDQGYTNPSATSGIQTFLSSYNTPRQVQITARLTF